MKSRFLVRAILTGAGHYGALRALPAGSAWRAEVSVEHHVFKYQVPYYSLVHRTLLVVLAPPVIVDEEKNHSGDRYSP